MHMPNKICARYLLRAEYIAYYTDMLPGHSDTPQDVKSSQSRIRKSTGQHNKMIPTLDI